MTFGPRLLALRHLGLACALALAASALAPSATAAEFGADVETFTLDNGMDVVVIPDRRVPVVTHMVWYRVGAADEAPGKSGVAHFLEHLMFKGTEAHPEGEFSRVVSELGGQENAFTSSDYTAYFQRVAKQHLRTMMEYESDRMTNLVLAPEEVESELQVVLEERRSRVDNDPSAQLGEALDAALYINHPYRRPIIGWGNEVAALTHEDAVDFYRTYYTPQNAILIVAGDVAADEVRTLAEETYGKVAPRGELPPRRRPQEPIHRAETTVTLASPRVDQESLRRAWLAPSYATAEAGEAEALDLMSEVLAGGSTSRLYRALVVDRKLATAAGGYYQGSALDQGRLMIYAVPRPGVSLEELAIAVDEVVAAFAEEGPTEAEFERARRGLIASTVYSQDSQQSLARIYGVALTTGSTVADVNGWISRLEKVTPDDVRRVARDHLDPDLGVTAYLQSKGEAAGQRDGQARLEAPAEQTETR